MEIVTLNVESRDKTLKAKKLVQGGYVLANYYGRGVQNRDFKIPYQEFRKAYKAAGNSTVIELNVDNKDKLNVLVHSVQTHPVKDTFMHVDFINVRMDEEITAKIPLKFVGMSVAVKDFGGTLNMGLNEVEVRCLPKDLMHSFEVSIDSLVDFHSTIHVSDLKFPKGVTVVSAPDLLVATVSAPRAEEAAPAVAAEATEAAPAAEKKAE